MREYTISIVFDDSYFGPDDSTADDLTALQSGNFSIDDAILLAKDDPDNVTVTYSVRQFKKGER